MLLRELLGPWQALLMSSQGRNVSRDGFVNLKISLNSVASFGSLAPSAVALSFFLAYKTLFINRNHVELAILCILQKFRTSLSKKIGVNTCFGDRQTESP